MKKIMTAMLGLTLALGSASLFAQEGKTGDTKTADTAKPKTHKAAKSHKAHKSSKAKTGTETAPAADATKK